MTRDTKRSAVGIAVFGLFFWISYSMLAKLGAELERICPMLEKMGDQCRTGADLGWLSFMVLVGSIGVGSIGYLASGFMLAHEPVDQRNS